MKSTTYELLDAIKLLDPAEQGRLFESMALRLSNGETVFVKAIQVEGTMLYAKAEDRAVFHMIPLETLIGFEIQILPKNTWFADAQTLPAIIAKLRAEAKKAAA